MATIRSRILLRNGSIEMGRKLAIILGSSKGFLSIGVIIACLKEVGKIPSIKE